MARNAERKSVDIPRWLATELRSQAGRIDVNMTVYITRLLEEGAGIRKRPDAWPTATSHNSTYGPLDSGKQ